MDPQATAAKFRVMISEMKVFASLD